MTVSPPAQGTQDSTCYVERSEVRKIILASRIAEEALRDIDALPILAASDFAPTPPSSEPVAWQYRVMFDKGSVREDEWCPWRDAGKKYFDKVNAEIAAGATRVQTRALYAHPHPAAGAEREAVATALERCDWSGMSIGNKCIINAAIDQLRATPHSPVRSGLEDIEDLISTFEQMRGYPEGDSNDPCFDLCGMPCCNEFGCLHQKVRCARAALRSLPRLRRALEEIAEISQNGDHISVRMRVIAKNALSSEGQEKKSQSSDGSGSPVEDNPDDPTATRLQQGAATSSKPSTAAEASRGKGSDAVNVAKPQIDPASAPHQSPGPSEALALHEGEREAKGIALVKAELILRKYFYNGEPGDLGAIREAARELTGGAA
jgi:hypothetical protein